MTCSYCHGGNMGKRQDPEPCPRHQEIKLIPLDELSRYLGPEHLAEVHVDQIEVRFEIHLPLQQGREWFGPWIPIPQI